jgi:hypothetical protein
VRAATALVLLSGAAGSAGCKDAAEPDYRRCEQLESQGKLDEALEACRAARAKDARSPMGELATKKEVSLLTRIDAKRRQQAAQDRSEKDQAKIEAAEAKVQWVLESTPPKDKLGMSEKCMAASRDFENAYSCMPKDPSSVPAGEAVPFLEECKLLAATRGCKPLHPESPDRYFCCTK